MSSKSGASPRASDLGYVGIAWKDGGRTRDGLDCAGLAALWLKEQMGIEFGDFSPPIQESELETLTARGCVRRTSRSVRDFPGAEKSLPGASVFHIAATGLGGTVALRPKERGFDGRRATLDNLPPS